MKKKLFLDKELVTSTEQIVVDVEGASPGFTGSCLSCGFTICNNSYCNPTPCTCSDEEE